MKRSRKSVAGYNQPSFFKFSSMQNNIRFLVLRSALLHLLCGLDLEL